MIMTTWEASVLPSVVGRAILPAADFQPAIFFTGGDAA
jgi:hypothetical protein